MAFRRFVAGLVALTFSFSGNLSVLASENLRPRGTDSPPTEAGLEERLLSSTGLEEANLLKEAVDLQGLSSSVVYPEGKVRDLSQAKAVLITADAGYGKRWADSGGVLPKVATPVAGWPAGWRTKQAAEEMGWPVISIVSYEKELVKAVFDRYTKNGIIYVKSEIPNGGTGYAFYHGGAVYGLRESQALVIASAGDQPLYDGEVLEAAQRKFLEGQRLEKKVELVIATALFDNPKGKGRIVRDSGENILGILEQADIDKIRKGEASIPEPYLNAGYRDADALEAIREGNVSIYAMPAKPFFDLLENTTNGNAQRQFYVTDIVGMVIKQEGIVEAVRIPHEKAPDLTTVADLAKAERFIAEHGLERGPGLDSDTLRGLWAKVGESSPALQVYSELRAKIHQVPVTNRVLSVELGGTFIRAGLVDSRTGEVLVGVPDWVIQFPVKPERRPENAGRVLEQIVQQASAVLAKVGFTRQEVGVISVGTPGDLDERTGFIQLQNNLPFTQQNLRDLIAAQFGGEVLISNDMTTAVRGEWLYGAGKGRKLLAYLTVSTGTNAAYRSPTGEAFDLGLWGYAAYDGKTVEEHTSGKHLARIAKERIQEPGGDRILKLAGGDPAAIEGKHVGQAFREGNPLAADIVEDAAHVLGRAIVEGTEKVAASGNLSEEPEVLWIAGGGVSQGLGERFVQMIQQVVDQELVGSTVQKRIKVVLSQMPASQRGLLGAAARAREAGLEEEGLLAPPEIPVEASATWSASPVTASPVSRPPATVTGVLKESSFFTRTTAVPGTIQFFVDTRQDPRTLRLAQLAAVIKAREGWPIDFSGVAREAELDAVREELEGDIGSQVILENRIVTYTSDRDYEAAKAAALSRVPVGAKRILKIDQETLAWFDRAIQAAGLRYVTEELKQRVEALLQAA